MAETVPLAWHHVRLRVPRHWEVVGYKNDADDARLVLSDRHGETMHLFARPWPDPPRLTRRLADQVLAAGRTDLTPGQVRRRVASRHGWRVFVPPEVGAPAFAGRYDAGQRVLIHLTFPPHRDRSVPTVEEVLRSFEPNAGEERHWALFGLEVRLPAAMRLRDVRPLPAAQVLRFENARGESVAVHRYGMMPLALAGEDAATFFARVQGRRCALRRQGAFLKDGRHEGVRLAYTTRGRGGFDILLARPWEGRVWFWRRDDLKRLCCADHHALPAHRMDDLPERVVCR